jgi:hypothetical protein
VVPQAARDAVAAAAAKPAVASTSNNGADAALIDQLKDELESATLDKMMAELKLEEAHEDLVDVQSKVSALEAKAATKMVGEGSGGGVGGADATQLKLAIEAVVKFRDELIMKDEYITEMEGVLREERRQNQKSEFNLAQRSEQLDSAVKKLGGLRDQLDENSGASGTMEDLSTKLMTMEESNQTMQGEIADLVSLIGLNDTIIEEHRQAEMDALDQLDTTERDYQKLGEAVKAVHTDSLRYKRAYHELKREFDEREAAGPSSVPTSAEDDQESDSHSASQEPDLALIEASSKALATAIELELRTLDAAHARTHLGMMKLFLPESFISHENSGIEVSMLLKSVGEKSGLIRRMTEKQFRLLEDTETLLANAVFTPDQLSFASDLLSTVAQLEASCNSLYAGLETADDAAYKNLASSHGDLKAHDSAVNEMLELVRTASLGPSVSLDKMSSALKQFQHTQVQNPTLCYSDNDLAASLLRLLLNTCTGLFIELKRVEDIYSKTTVDGGKDSAFGEFIARIQAWQVQVKDLIKLVRKATRGLPDSSTSGTILKPEMKTMLSATLQCITGITQGLRATSSACWDHMRGSATLKALSIGQADQIATKHLIDLSVEGVHTERLISQGTEAALLPLHFVKVLATSSTDLADFVNALEFGGCDGPIVPQSKLSPPWEVRGSKMRDQIAESLAMESLVEDKQKLILAEKANAAKLKKEISVFTVKLAGATKQVDSAKSDLQLKIDNIKLQLEESNTALIEEKADRAEDVASLEEACSAAEQKAEELRKKMEFAPKKSHALVDMRSARLKLETMEQALRVTRGELALLRGTQAQASLSSLTPLVGDYKLAKNKELVDVSSKTNTYLRKLQSVIATPVIVDISQKGKRSSAAMLALAAAQMESLRVEGGGLKSEAYRALAVTAAAGDAGSSFSKFMSPEFLKVLKERKQGKKAATIRMPANSNSIPSASIDVTAGQLASLHNALLA